MSSSDSEDDESTKKQKASSSKRSRSGSADSASPERKKQMLSDSDNEVEAGEVVETQDAARKDDSSGDEGIDPNAKEEPMNDFEAMMAKKKELRGNRRKKNSSVDIINNNEELMSAIVNKMRRAAEEDRQLNKAGKPATNKLSLLSMAMSQIVKTDLLEGFLDANILSALTDWLAPMPDKSLPSAAIREDIIKWLTNLPALSQEMLKTSGIGKAVMYLYRHPRESRANKDKCGRLIAKWSRPIFNNSDDFKSLTKQERVERDYDMKRRGALIIREQEKAEVGDKNARPGERGFVWRARVPMHAKKDYVVRPSSTAEGEVRKKVKHKKNRLEKQMMRFERMKALSKTRRAVNMSIQGNNMPL